MSDEARSGGEVDDGVRGDTEEEGRAEAQPRGERGAPAIGEDDPVRGDERPERSGEVKDGGGDPEEVAERDEGDPVPGG